jgi:diguanylate cyclase (GGDEF)-like protein/putative nucleotidyltransferase with HDIG domain
MDDHPITVAPLSADLHHVSARKERDELAAELERARRRIAELETEIIRRGRDPLSGMVRIETFREHLTDEVQRARRHDRPSALVLLELDRMSEVHRDHGFESGDAVLRAVVEAVRAGTRAEDVLARTGDCRFALLLCDADAQAAMSCVERLLGDFAALQIGPVRGISTAAGIAPFGLTDEATDLLDRAARALADAQAAGGGRVVTALISDPSGAGVVAAIHRRDAVEALAVALLERDRYTGEHSESVVDMAAKVAGALGLSQDQVEDVRSAALLHDIGKVGIPDAILNKPGPLTPEERDVMAEHPVIGERILRSIGGFSTVAAIVRHEHESFDGSGYPDGISGSEIPIGSRIILACDAYHAMTSDRPYRKRMSHVDAFAELTRCAGRQFDPDVTGALAAYFYHRRPGHLALAG